MEQLASTFLSHSTADKPLVEAVATELGKRGIIAWLDKEELYPGQDLTRALLEAIKDQATLSVFVSIKALRSTWVEIELGVALDRYEKAGLEDHIKPIYLGEPFDLIAPSRLLAGRWMSPKGNAVDKLGIRVDPADPIEDQARSVATELANGIYGSLHSDEHRDVLINLDQRGSLRRGKPEGIPSNHQKIEGAALVFRPRRRAGADKETIVGEEWDRLAVTMRDALRTAFKGLRWRDQKNIYISGNAQLGLAYLIGHHFNRSSDVVLYCTDTRGTSFNNEGWDRTDMLRGGNPDCAANSDAGLPTIPTTPFQEVVLVVGRQNILEGVLPYLDATRPDTAVAWVRTPDRLNSSAEVKSLIADVTALAQRLKRENGCRVAYLVLGLPFAAVPLFAAHMPYVLERFVLLEHRGDLVGTPDVAETYAPLHFPG